MDRVALVTGGNRGLGLEICRQLARRDIRVILSSRDAVAGAQAAEILAREGLRLSVHCLDVSSAADVKLLGERLSDDFGRCDILVNNAGMRLGDADAGILDETGEGLREALAVNLVGAVCVAQTVAPLMVRQAYGRVVNVSSSLAQLATMGNTHAAHRLSKAALNAVTLMLSQALAGSGVLVNSMCPGAQALAAEGSDAPVGWESAADTAIWLATLPKDGPTGGFFRDRRPMAW